MLETATARTACPRCRFQLTSEGPECPACGIVFTRFEEAQRAAELEPSDDSSGDDPFVEPEVHWGLGGAVSPGVVAGLMHPPRPLRWVAGLNTASGVIHLLIAAALFFLARGASGVASAVVTNVLYGAVALWVGWATRRLIPAARIVLFIGAFLSLLAVPVGTLLSILLLRYLFHPGMEVLFSRKQPDELTPREVEHLLDLEESRAGVWFVRVVKFFLVLGLLGILAAVGFGGLGVMRGFVKETRAISELKQIDYAVRTYTIGHEGYPPTQGIPDLARRFRTPLPFVDPWGRPYRYEKTGSKFRVGSAGPDGKWERHGLSGYAEDTRAGDDLVVVSGRLAE